MKVTMRKLGQRTVHDYSSIAVSINNGWLALSELPKALQGVNSVALWEIDGECYLSNTVQTGPRCRVLLRKPE